MTSKPSPVSVALAGLAALALAIGIGRFAFTPLLAMMQKDQGLSFELGGWLASSNLLGYLIGGLTAQFLRSNPAGSARLSVVLVTLGTIIMAWPYSPYIWGTGRFIAGLASAWMMISISMLCLPVLAATPRLAAWVYAGVGVGITLTGTLCLVMVLGHQASATTWTLLALACVGLGYPVWRTFKTPIKFSGKPSSHNDKHAINVDGTAQGTQSSAVYQAGSKPKISATNPATINHLNTPTPLHARTRLRLLTWCYGLYGFGYILPATFLPAQARIWLGESWTYSLAWPLFGLAAAISTWAAGFLLKRMARLPIWGTAHIVMALGLIAPAISPSITTIMIAALCVGGTFLVITLVAMQEAQQYGGQEAGKWMARLTTAFAAGQVLGPVLVSLWGGLLKGAQDRALELALWAASGVLLFAAILIFSVNRSATLDNNHKDT